MMWWFVVHFFNDESVEAVPDTWFKKDKCAWPNDRKNVKRYIEKRIIPNKLEFSWLPARKLGNAYNSLESARSKSKVAQYLSDLSANEGLEMIRSEETRVFKKKNDQFKRIASPPALKTADINKKMKVLVSTNANTSETEEETYDSDKDPEYICTPRVKDNDDKILSSQLSETLPSANVKNSAFYVQSPIGKIMVEDIDSNLELHTCGKTNNLTSTAERQLNNESNEDNNTSITYIHSPIGKVRIENITSISEPRFYENSKRSTLTAKRSLNFEAGTSKLSMGSPTFDLNTSKKPFMSNADFQAFVINSLTKIKFEISSMSSTIHANHLSSEAFYNKVGHSTSLNLSNNIQQSLDISGIFPINTDQQLKIFDEKLKSDNDYKLNMIAKLSLFVGIKNVGDSVRRLMSRMFADELLQNYSLLGFKKKNRFSDLLVYRLILDVIRVQPKFSSTLDKEIDVPISTWLSHAKFRIKDKNILKL